ncbi:hypothetical protein ACFLQL_00765 [Verrucomicrobiota bacterium]
MQMSKIDKICGLTPEELEQAMRSVFGIDGRGLRWKAQRLYDLLGECPEEVRRMCDKLRDPNDGK